MKKMIRYFMLIFVTLFIISCSNKEDKYVGIWKNVGRKDVTLEIKKVGEQKTYIVKLTTPGIWSPKAREEEFTGLLDDGILKVSIPLMGATPILLDNEGLHFSDGSSCKDCNLYKK